MVLMARGVPVPGCAVVAGGPVPACRGRTAAGVEVGSGSAAGARRRRNRAAEGARDEQRVRAVVAGGCAAVRRSFGFVLAVGSDHPVTALDQIAMLQAAQIVELLAMVHDFSKELSQTLAMGWPDATQ